MIYQKKTFSADEGDYYSFDEGITEPPLSTPKTTTDVDKSSPRSTSDEAKSSPVGTTLLPYSSTSTATTTKPTRERRNDSEQ